METRSKIKSPDLGYRNFLKGEISSECLKKTNIHILRQKVSRKAIKIADEKPNDEKYIKRLLKIPRNIKLLEIRQMILDKPELFEQVGTLEGKLLFLRSLEEDELIRFYKQKYKVHGTLVEILEKTNPKNLKIAIDLLEIINPEDISKISKILIKAKPNNLSNLIMMLLYKIKIGSNEEVLNELPKFEKILIDANPQNLYILHTIGILEKVDELLKFENFLENVHSKNFKILCENLEWKRIDITIEDLLKLENILRNSKIDKQGNSNLEYIMRVIKIKAPSGLLELELVLNSSNYSNLVTISKTFCDMRNCINGAENIRILNQFKYILELGNPKIITSLIEENSGIGIYELLSKLGE